MVAMLLKLWNRVVEEQKEQNEAAGGQGRYTRLAWRLRLLRLRLLRLLGEGGPLQTILKTNKRGLLTCFFGRLEAGEYFCSRNAMPVCTFLCSG